MFTPAVPALLKSSLMPTAVRQWAARTDDAMVERSCGGELARHQAGRQVVAKLRPR
jgi:hypothetical protein